MSPIIWIHPFSSTDWRSDPGALGAIKPKASGLVAERGWRPETDIGKGELLEWASKEGKKSHLADLLVMCANKYYQMHDRYSRHQNRTCFRRRARDEKGGVAVYQELAMSPTMVRSASSILAHGCPERRATQADAVLPSVPSILNAKYDMYVRILKEVLPHSLHDPGRNSPCFKLNKALYGHPEVVGHWEAHLHKAIRACGGTAIPNHSICHWLKNPDCS